MPNPTSPASTKKKLGSRAEDSGTITMSPPSISVSFSGDTEVLPIDNLASAGRVDWNEVLTELVDRSGYFLAGGLAGIVSRTVTAPLDRLKVYLIAQTSNTTAAVEAAKGGSPLRAVRHFGRPLIEATKELWKAGGIRSLFAGRLEVLSNSFGNH